MSHLGSHLLVMTTDNPTVSSLRIARTPVYLRTTGPQTRRSPVRSIGASLARHL